MQRLIVVTMLALALSAQAQEPSFEALGQAPIVAGDRVRARDRALDEALRQAVEQATATVLDPAELEARAAGVARSGTAQAALVAHVGITPGGTIRGTDDLVAAAHADVKLVEPDGRASATGSAERAGYAVSFARAAESSARLAVAEAARAIEPALAQRWSGEAAPSGGVAVALTRLTARAGDQALTP